MYMKFSKTERRKFIIIILQERILFSNCLSGDMFYDGSPFFFFFYYF